jgi:hypothetical protein
VYCPHRGQYRIRTLHDHPRNLRSHRPRDARNNHRSKGDGCCGACNDIHHILVDFPLCNGNYGAFGRTDTGCITSCTHTPRCDGHHCKNCRNRRLLTCGYSLRREDDGYANFLGDCAAVEYDIALYVDNDNTRTFLLSDFPTRAPLPLDVRWSLPILLCNSNELSELRRLMLVARLCYSGLL